MHWCSVATMTFQEVERLQHLPGTPAMHWCSVATISFQWTRRPQQSWSGRPRVEHSVQLGSLHVLSPDVEMVFMWRLAKATSLALVDIVLALDFNSILHHQCCIPNLAFVDVMLALGLDTNQESSLSTTETVAWSWMTDPSPCTSSARGMCVCGGIHMLLGRGHEACVGRYLSCSWLRQRLLDHQHFLPS